MKLLFCQGTVTESKWSFSRQFTFSDIKLNGKFVEDIEINSGIKLSATNKMFPDLEKSLSVNKILKFRNFEHNLTADIILYC